MTRTTSRPPATEGKPWDTLNTDGRPNLGSYEVGDALDAAKLAHRLFADYFDDQPPLRREIAYLAKLLLRAADVAQATATGANPDRQAASHKHATRAVAAALEVHPVPWGADDDERTAWFEQLSNRASMLLELARDLIHDPDTSP